LDDRVFHQKFGYGNVVKIDGNKLTIAFEKTAKHHRPARARIVVWSIRVPPAT